MGFIEEQIQKNIANRVAIEKAMGKEFTESDCLDLLEKAGKAAQMGEVRTWNGKEYIKTFKGWRPKPKGYKEGEKKQEVTEAGNPVGKPESVTPKKVTDQLKVGDRVMYNGKEMTLTRISKDGRFQNGIEMKFVNEGDSTQTGGKTLLGNMMYAKPVKEKGPATAANKLEADKEKKDVSKNLSSRKKEISTKIRELNKLSDEVERLEDLMYDDDYDEDDELNAELEYGDEYEKVSAKFDKAARETQSMIKKFMKDVDPKFKAPKGAVVWELIEMFKKVKL